MVMVLVQRLLKNITGTHLVGSLKISRLEILLIALVEDITGDITEPHLVSSLEIIRIEILLVTLVEIEILLVTLVESLAEDRDREGQVAEMIQLMREIFC